MRTNLINGLILGASMLASAVDVLEEHGLIEREAEPLPSEDGPALKEELRGFAGSGRAGADMAGERAYIKQAEDPRVPDYAAIEREREQHHRAVAAKEALQSVRVQSLAFALHAATGDVYCVVERAARYEQFILAGGAANSARVN